MTLNGLFGRTGPLTIVVVVGIALSLLAFIAVSQHKTDRANTEFSARATGYANLIADGFARVIFAIESVGAFYGASGSVTSAQFDEFVAPMLDRFPTIAALGWVPRTTQADRFDRVGSL